MPFTPFFCSFYKKNSPPGLRRPTGNGPRPTRVKRSRPCTGAKKKKIGTGARPPLLNYSINGASVGRHSVGIWWCCGAADPPRRGRDLCPPAPVQVQPPSSAAPTRAVTRHRRPRRPRPDLSSAPVGVASSSPAWARVAAACGFRAPVPWIHVTRSPACPRPAPATLNKAHRRQLIKKRSIVLFFLRTT
jgi:hypothetical protein